MTISAPQKFGNGNLKPMEMQPRGVVAAHEALKGRDPRKLSAEEFASLGFVKRPLLAVIRENCIECQGGQGGEVLRCCATGCVFWPHRMGTNPWTAVGKGLTEAQKAANVERLRNARLRALAPAPRENTDAEAPARCLETDLEAAE